MTRIHLYVLDNDRDYSERLAEFIRSTAFADQLQIKLFTQPDLLLQVLEDSNVYGVLLLSEAYYPLFKNQPTSLTCMYLSENITNSRSTDSGHPFLFRFQPLHSLLSRLVAFYMEGKQENPRSVSGSRTRIISVFSSSGHIGKTITAIHMAKQLAFRGERVFYLSLENVSTASQWLQGETGQMSQLLYFVKSSPGCIGVKLELYKSHDTRLHFDFLTPAEQMREMQEMSGEHVRELLNSIMALALYDTIIVDLETSVHPRIVKCLELSNAIIWLLHDDWQDVAKTKALLKQMNACPQVHYVMNQFRGYTVNDFEFLGKKLAYRLPYIPEWKALHTPDQIWQSDIFGEQVYSMLQAITQIPIGSCVEGVDTGNGSTVVS